jgi:hypothetical protein
MHLDWLQPVTSTSGPLATAHLDVTRAQATADREVELRWDAVQAQLREDGAPEEVVEAVRERALAPTGAGGELGRSIVASSEGVLVDRVVPQRPVHDSGSYGVVPHLLPLVRALAMVTPYVLVQVDHRGADVAVVDALGGATEEHEVEGGHDVLHRFGGGGWAHRRFQMRVLDSWERNAEAVVADLEGVVAQHGPELVLLAGDPQSRSFVHRHASGRVADRLVDLETGGRAEGVSGQALVEAVEAVTTRHRQTVMGEVVARFEQERGRGGVAADGLAAVVDALRLGSVETLLLQDDPSSTARLWAGPDPLQLGTTADDVRALGTQDVVEDRADAVVLRALVAQAGQVELVAGADVLRGGVGALLRFDVRPDRPG